MKLIHTTRLGNLDSIREFGLLLSYSRSTRRPAVWLHTVEQNDWAETHVRMMHDAQDGIICHIEVETGDLKVVAHGKGLYFIEEDVGVDPHGRVWCVDRTLTLLS
jgi:hypothetical protein